MASFIPPMCGWGQGALKVAFTALCHGQNATITSIYDVFCWSSKLRQPKMRNGLTLRERPLTGSAALPDNCGKILQLHVRRLAYPAKGRLQLLGCDQPKGAGRASLSRKKEESMQVGPYLFFNGRCDEALEFYRSALGAEVTHVMRFKESPEPDACPAGAEEKVMHANLRIGDTTVMVSDGYCEGKPEFHGFSLLISLDDGAEAERLFTALTNGGEVQRPLAKTFWSPRFGMVNDRFGVSWIINVVE